ncbi:MAG: hypothetical protein CVV27_19375 [Candidatus Melainabacteria bacterium HGW-Melainabacteria-1]|nr:MAG: hypothetical protein CVV27_19375 [Candidatus Melainabacteria bacterium HGW-Melainabacteria-1]
MSKLKLLPLLALLAGCQPSGPVLPMSSPAAFRQQATPITTMPLTAKVADNEAWRLAQQWAAEAHLTHVLGRSITASGQPHASSGSWTFSFIDQQNPQKALQIVFRVKSKPLMRRLSTQQLSQPEPLEIRAWGLDSDRAVLKAKEFFGQVSLRQMELTRDPDGRLIWSFDGKPLLDAMHGLPYQPLKR